MVCKVKEYIVEFRDIDMKLQENATYGFTFQGNDLLFANQALIMHLIWYNIQIPGFNWRN